MSREKSDVLTHVQWLLCFSMKIKVSVPHSLAVLVNLKHLVRIVKGTTSPFQGRCGSYEQFIYIFTITYADQAKNVLVLL